MSSSDWDEIRRLAADFQKIQLSSTLQRLSERNCVEIVSLLIKQGNLNVIFTNDGKEYITPEYLRKEIEDELFVHGGRINLVELAKILNVDLSHVGSLCERLTRERPEVHVVLGQLVDDNYLERIAIEINEKLSQDGELSVSDLTVQFDLPSEFLLENVMEKYLGKLIRGRQDTADSRVFFTQNYINRCKSKIRGALAALTRPTAVQQILQQIGIQERIFHSLINEVGPAGVVTSKQVGAQYVPHIYTRNQSDWIESFYRQNGYLEFEAVNRLGVSDAKSFIKRQLANEKLTFLSKCCVGQRIVDQIESTLDESISSGSYLDAMTILPSIMVEEDIEQLLSHVLTAAKQKQTIVFGTTILTTQFIDGLLNPCHELAEKNAKAAVDSGKYQQYIAEKIMGSNKNVDGDVETKADRKDERRKKASGGKAGGGAQGRETKTKSTKKHYRGGGGDRGNHSESDDDTIVSSKKKEAAAIELISLKEITKIFEKQLESEGLEDLAGSLAKHYYPGQCKTALETAHKFYEISLQNSSQNRRQTHAALQEKLNALLVDIRLAEKGLRLLPNDLQLQLVKYLLKTHGQDFCNELCLYVAAECNLNYTDTTLTSEQRNKIAQESSQEYKATLVALNKAVVGTSIDDFFTSAENALESCSMIVKKVDKKKDRTLVLCHKHSLLDQLSKCNDPALTLHLVILIIFTVSTQNILHASGKFVSSILSFLQPSLNQEQSNTLKEYHDLVLKLLTSKPDSGESKHVTEQLESKLDNIKSIATTYKKPGVTNAE